MCRLSLPTDSLALISCLSFPLVQEVSHWQVPGVLFDTQSQGNVALMPKGVVRTGEKRDR